MPKKSLDLHDINAQRDVVMGDQTNITYVIQVPGFQPPADLNALSDAYLAHLRRTHHAVDFRGILQLQSFSRELLLEDVYVPLLARPEQPAGETWVRRVDNRRLAGRTLEETELSEEWNTLSEEEEIVPPVHIEEALGQHGRVIVIGDPGSGKSTLLKYLALRLASESKAPLPILVPLNAYAEALGEDKDLNLQTYLPRYFAGLAHGLSSLHLLFDSALNKGQAVVLLDGLDEVQIHRGHLIHKIESFASEISAKGNKLIVTSRIVGYKDAPLNPRDWRLYTLLDFDRQAIEDFATKWCPAFEICTLGDTPEAASRAVEERRALLESLDANPGVAQLAANPLLLTILALIKRQGVLLPNHRIELYELYLKTLIETWNQARSLDRRPVGPLMNTREIISVLGPLALRIRQDNPTYGLISEDRLLDWLADYYQGDEWGLMRGEACQRAGEFLESVQRYSNLLVERGHQRYGFLHLTFEEALAARGLEKLAQTDFPQSQALILEHVTDPAWRETILLAIGVWGLIRENDVAAGKVVQAILEAPCPTECAGQTVLLAGECLENVGTAGVGRVVAQRVQEVLLEAVRNRRLTPTVQREAGFILARTGWIPNDLDEFIDIPSGTFLYGKEKRERKITHPFRVAKYPVTNLQYRRFKEAGGYNHQKYWSKEGWLWRTGQYDNEARDEFEIRRLSNRPPERRGESYFWHERKWNNPLAPVVGVNWYEAEAYCNWLTDSKRDNYRFSLPTEEQWERAARGVKGRTYAWGNEGDKNHLNCCEFWGDEQLGMSTTVVIQFHQGKTPDGIYDMNGNVWEWTNSIESGMADQKVVRGGNWYNFRDKAQCYIRDYLVSISSNNRTGFRVFAWLK
jgi:formylglycine-generating enzyme required for sulfatase activity